MSILSDFEDRISRAVEHGFASVFRAPVQPAELARKLGKEMDRGKKLGVGKVYAPTLYNIFLSRQDDTSLGGFAETLAGELETYLIGYAREHNYQLAARPCVRFLVDPALKLGRFEIIGELLSPEEMAEELGYTPEDDQFETPREPSLRPMSGEPLAGPPIAAAPVVPAAPVPGHPWPTLESAKTNLNESEAPPARPAAIFDADEIGLDFGGPTEAPPEPATQPRQPLATVTVRGVDHDVVLRGDRVVVGRLQSCEICLSDVNVSREHAAFEREGLGWAIRDLGSTNGTLVNSHRVTRERLRDGDLIVIGVTELVYHEPRG